MVLVYTAGSFAFTKYDYSSSSTGLLLQVFQGLRCDGTEENVFNCSTLGVLTSCPWSLNAYAICQGLLHFIKRWATYFICL